jgi:DNA-binding NarL/FixJ family response regulator
MVLDERAQPLHGLDVAGQDVVPRRKDQGSQLRVLAVEDHPLFYDGLQLLFQGEEEFELVGQATNRAEAVALARHYQPHVILLDIGLADANGLDLVSQLARICPDAKIVVVTGRPEQEYLMTALQLGVHAFLPKDAPGSAILGALRAVVRGERIIGQPEALSSVLVEFGRVLRERERQRRGLTDQEIEILKLAAAGLNNKDIGVQQFWSEITIKRKMQDIYRKLDVKSRAQAVAEAIRLGLI